VIAKLDRLSRNAPFLLGLRDAGIDFVCCDMPNANRLTVGIMALVAEDERERISERTKQALAAARRRGVKLGGARGVVPSRKARALAAEAVQERVAARASDLAPIIAELQAVGITSWEGIARRLTDDGIKTARGKSTWSATQAGRLLARLSTP
jgi:DNA invertase Pin-like site-specific DNA recombinase